MLAVLYLIAAFLVGFTLKQLLRIETLSLFTRISGRTNKLPPEWTFDFPFSLIVGGTILTTLHYYISYFFSFILPETVNPLLATNLLMVFVLPAFFLISYMKALNKRHLHSISEYFTSADSFYWKSIWFFALFGTFLIFYSFFVYKGMLRSGFSVFGDFAPHTALINSFAKGNNFPTQYPHFSGDGIKYHFFFFYLCGNLQYLGMRIDFAMNIPSILGILSFVSLLGCLGVLLTKRKWVFFLAPFMLFFRSSYAIFSYLQEIFSKKGSTFFSIIGDILNTNKFIGLTPRDDWGLWTMNVYANQRHFLWGFSIMLIIFFVFLPSLKEKFNFAPDGIKFGLAKIKPLNTNEDLAENINKPETQIFDLNSFAATSIVSNKKSSLETSLLENNNDNNYNNESVALKKSSPNFLGNVVFYFTNPEYWKISNIRELILCVVLIACLPYWHGSMLISLLCILFVMAFFARNRLSYIIVALAGVMSSFLQAGFFSGGAKGVAKAQFLWGFISVDKSLPGVASYLFQVIGIALAIIVVLPFIQTKRINKRFIIACMAPILFALCISMTPDVTVNHKYVIIAVGLLNIFIADALCTLWQFTSDSLKALKRPVSKASRINSFVHGRSNENIDSVSDNRVSDNEQNINSKKTPGQKIIALIVSFVLSVFVTFSLCATGVVELIGYVNKNVNTVGIDLNSPLTKWIEKNTSPSDVFLTAPYHMNEFFFSGRKVFYGWAYFTWSAGHDTVTREALCKKMFSGYGGDIARFISVAKKNKIRYMIIDDDLLKEVNYNLNVQFFKANFKVAASFPSSKNATIYRLY